MKYTIDTDICEKYGLSEPEVFLLLTLCGCEDLNELKSLLCSKSALVEFDNKLYISNKYKSIVQNIILDSEGGSSQKRLTEIANKLIELFPTGLKPGTNYMWRGSATLIVKRLKMVERIYNVTLHVDECVDAAKRYIASFHNNHEFMQLLKYFIIKDEESQLMSFIENSDSDNEDTNELQYELRFDE